MHNTDPVRAIVRTPDPEGRLAAPARRSLCRAAYRLLGLDDLGQPVVTLSSAAATFDGQPVDPASMLVNDAWSCPPIPCPPGCTCRGQRHTEPFGAA